MVRMRVSRVSSTAIVLALAFMTDIALKVWVRSAPANAGRFAFWPSVGPIGIVPSVNDVLAFSLPIPNAVIWPIGWLVVLFLIHALVCSGRRFQIPDSPPKADPPQEDRFQIRHYRLAIGAIILGAISNLIDRTFLGGVTDYLSFTNMFPAFNIADVLILDGIAGWWWHERRGPRNVSRAQMA